MAAHRLYAAYDLIALRGLRRGEACGLRWCDIDLDTGTAIISWQLQQYDGHVTLCPKSPHSDRIIALDRTTVAALVCPTAHQLAERATAGEDYFDYGYVFTRLNGDSMAPDWLSCYFRQLNDASACGRSTPVGACQYTVRSGVCTPQRRDHRRAARRRVSGPHRVVPGTRLNRTSPWACPPIALLCL